MDLMLHSGRCWEQAPESRLLLAVTLAEERAALVLLMVCCGIGIAAW